MATVEGSTFEGKPRWVPMGSTHTKGALQLLAGSMQESRNRDRDAMTSDWRDPRWTMLCDPRNV
jgi:hypothetical protein